MKSHSATRLLIVDDEKDIANITKIWMASKGFAADVFYHPEQALSAF
jgi:DNA-binding response OmpR family regulator